jgi:hypothetical protein
MGAAARKQPFSDLSDTDLDEYERYISATWTLAGVLREAERFIESEHEMSGSIDCIQCNRSAVLHSGRSR